jgi:queuine tRNA-ribosyltransferase
MFKILKKDKKTKARLGVLTTQHGKVNTPSYVIVATYGKIKCLKSSDIKKTKTQIVIANTYHLKEEVKNYKNLNFGKNKTFLLKKLGTNIPTMTDSGGFQVLSLAFEGKNRLGKFIKDNNNISLNKDYKRKKIKITDKGVYFKSNEKWHFFGPKLSMKIQEKIGADIVFAFDHITSPLDNYNYNKKAVILTNKWALECLKYRNNKQHIYGIIQGGLFKDLRIKSAKSIGKMSFSGFGIGGSYTKKQISKILKWVIPYLPEEKPRHLLGVGGVEDIFEAVENGIDTFDCVIPTREARHGRIYTTQGTFDILKNQNLTKTLDKKCKCPVCKKNIKRNKIRTMFKGTKKDKQKAQRLMTIHNIWFFNNLLEKIRNSIKKQNLISFKKNFLKKFNSSNLKNQKI